jgi:hypothetical protein
MGDSFYHIFTTPYLFFLTLFFKWRGVGIHDVITKNYHMSVITLISGIICDKMHYYSPSPNIPGLSDFLVRINVCVIWGNIVCRHLDVTLAILSI